jgi:tRNA (guanine-N7-)-methyltransferase
VACQGHVIGKPADENEAREFLRLLTTHRHAVVTGLCVLDARTGERQVAHDVTWVTMRRMTDAELDGYIASCGWQGKSGAYAIQAGGDAFIESLAGSESNVIGLPTERVAEMVPYTFDEYLTWLYRDTVARNRDLIVTEFDAKKPDDLLARFQHPRRPLEIEIGPGKDDFVVQVAAEAPETNFLAIERLRERVDKLCARIRRAGLTNVRVFFGDARYVFDVLLRPDQVQAVYVQHPDPYPKRRHARRRLFQPEFTERLARRLAPGGRISVSTDARPYAQQILTCLDETPGLANCLGRGQWTTDLPGHHQSVYERKRRAAGCVIYYMLFTKEPSQGAEP